MIGNINLETEQIIDFPLSPQVIIEKNLSRLILRNFHNITSAERRSFLTKNYSKVRPDSKIEVLIPSSHNGFLTYSRQIANRSINIQTSYQSFGGSHAVSLLTEHEVIAMSAIQILIKLDKDVWYQS